MPYRTLEVYLESLFVQENGALGEDAAANLLTARLVYPRPGIPSVTSIKELALGDDETREFGDEAFSRRILFKERIQGITEIALHLSVQLPADRIPALARALLTSAAGAGLAVLGAAAGTPLLSAAASRGRRELLRADLGGSDDDGPVALLGVGSTEISSDELSERGSVLRNVELRVPRPLTLRRTRPEMERDPATSGRYHAHYRATREEVHLAADDVSGWINLRLRVE